MGCNTRLHPCGCLSQTNVGRRARRHIFCGNVRCPFDPHGQHLKLKVVGTSVPSIIK